MAKHTVTQRAYKLTKRYGENIICANGGAAALSEGRKRARRLSVGRNHSWAQLYYSISFGDGYMQETWWEGTVYGRRTHVGGFRYSTCTIADAIVRLRKGLRKGQI